MSEKIEVFVGSGNVFADLVLSNPEERQLKAQLSIAIENAIKDKRLTKKQAAEKLGLEQHSLSELLEGGLSEFSVSQLTNYLHCLGYDVQLSATVRERAPKAEKPRPQEAREAVTA